MIAKMLATCARPGYGRRTAFTHEKAERRVRQKILADKMGARLVGCQAPGPD